MSAESTAQAGRRAAEAQMIATCRVLRKTGRMTQDETTGAEVPVYAVLFTSKCKVQLTDSVEGAVDAAGRQVVTYRARLDLPVTCPQPAQFDVPEILTNPTDPRLVGEKFLIQAPMNKTYATATRLQIESAHIPMVVS